MHSELKQLAEGGTHRGLSLVIAFIAIDFAIKLYRRLPRRRPDSIFPVLLKRAKASSLS